MLDKIPNKEEMNRMSSRQLRTLAQDIRRFIIEKVSKKGGHLSANLGVVELTMALFMVYDPPKDKVIFDVGHQSYIWKLLTGRKDGFDTLREFGGMSGFPKRRESSCDAFDTGHASTSVSAAVGYVKARDLKQEDYSVAAVIGDGSLTGGEAYEALNNAARLKSNLVIILNDNQMSIAKNVGGVNRYLTSIRTGRKYNRAKEEVRETLNTIPKIGSKVARAISDVKDSVKEVFVPSGMLFENMGITYLGPVDGHNIRQLKKVMEKARELDRAVLIHVLTKKGKGYKPAEEHPDAFHGVDAFDAKTGKVKGKKKTCWSDVFGSWIDRAAANDPSLTAVTAAMGDNVGLTAFKAHYPDRFFDVGIAEEHAVTFAAGMAAGGMHPVCAVFSSFLQRSYDQIVHDVCLQDLPVIFAIDRAGIVGKDGETHQGVFDLSYLLPVPNMCVMAPKDRTELVQMLDFAKDYHHPAAVRYPRGEAADLEGFPKKPLIYGKAEVLRSGKDIAILAAGTMTQTALEAYEYLKEKGIEATVVNMRFLKPFDEALIRELAENHSLFVTLEDGVVSGGFGEHIAAFQASGSHPVRTVTLGIADKFVPHGDVDSLKKMLKLDALSVAERILKEQES